MQKDTVTLKSMATTRITTDLLETTILDCQKSCPFTILVVDNFSARILNSYLTMSTLLNKGIFTVEHIATNRNRFPNYGVIYFLSPTEKSINYLINDFADLKKPKYNRIYLFFTHRLDTKLMDKLVTEGIVKRTVLFKELNLSFYSREDNVFDFDWKSGLKIFHCDNATELKLIDTICDRLFTVCTTMNFHPYIQYMKKSKFCAMIADKVEGLFTSYSFSRNMKKEGILLLTDRSLDPTSPFLHDYNYKALTYDLMDVKDNKIELNKKKIILSDDDELWYSYKLLHIAEVNNKLSNDFDEFRKSDLSKIGNASDLDSFSDMKNALTNMSTYKLKNEQLSCQLNLAEELNKRYKTNHLYDLIELEQDIVSGQNDGGSINNRDIFKNFTITKSKLVNQREDFLRVLLVLYNSLSIGEKDFNVLSGKLSPEEEAILKSLGYLGITQNDESKIMRRKMTLMRDKVSTVSDRVSKNTYSSLRTTPIISVITERASNYHLSPDQYPFNNWDKGEMPKVEKKYGTRNLFGGSDNVASDFTEMEPMIVFCVGGISHNEIVALEKLQKNNVLNHRLVIGSTCLMNANEYIRQLEIIDKGNEKEVGIDCFEIENVIEAKVNVDQSRNTVSESILNEGDSLI